MTKISDFVRAYLECALWSSLDEYGDAFDAVCTIDDIADEAIAQAVEDCEDFQRSNRAALKKYIAERSEADAGHDFWLTRNGHGAGFWDRGLGKLGDQLSDAAKVYGSVDVYTGDDGNLYFR